MQSIKTRRQLTQALKMELIYICKGHKERKASVRYLLNALEEQDTRNPAAYSNPELKKVLAVEQALAHTEHSLRSPLWQNITERTPYELLVVPIGRQGFYRERTNFLKRIAAALRYI